MTEIVHLMSYIVEQNNLKISMISVIKNILKSPMLNTSQEVSAAAAGSRIGCVGVLLCLLCSIQLKCYREIN